MTAQFITDRIEKANDYIKKGWVLKDHKLEVSSSPVDIRNLTDYGVDIATQANRIEARTFILELENATRCTKKIDRSYFQEKEETVDCEGCSKCKYTGFIQEKK